MGRDPFLKHWSLRRFYQRTWDKFVPAGQMLDDSYPTGKIFTSSKDVPLHVCPFGITTVLVESPVEVSLRQINFVFQLFEPRLGKHICQRFSKCLTSLDLYSERNDYYCSES